MAWLSGYNFRKPIVIAGSTAGVQTNYQMKLTVHYGNGADAGGVCYCNSNCQTDFEDIRFTQSDGETLLDCWQEYNVASTTAIYWIEFNSIAADPATSSFYMYFGNTGVSYPYEADAKTHGDNTFIIFDDFERGNDGDEAGGIWTEGGGVIEISTGQDIGDSAGFYGTRSLKLEGGAALPIAQITSTPTANTASRFRLYKEDAATFYFIWDNGTDRLYMLVEADEDIGYYIGGAFNDTGENLDKDAWTQMEFRDIDYSGTTYDIIHWPSGSETTAGDDVSMRGSTAAADTLKLYGIANAGDDVWVDNFIIRNYCNPEPTWGTWGATEGAAAVGAGSITPTGALASVLTIAKAVGDGAIAITGALASVLTLTKAVGDGAIAITGSLTKYIVRWLKLKLTAKNYRKLQLTAKNYRELKLTSGTYRKLVLSTEGGYEMDKHYVGATPYLRCKVYDQDGALVDPTTSITCTIEDPNGTLASASATEAMTQEGAVTGIYYYAGWTIASGDISGIYRWRVTTTDTAVVSIEEGNFEVSDR